LIAVATLGGAAMPAIAQDHGAPQTYSARDEQAQWRNDPAFHAFYDATVEAFANGPDRVDRAAYEARSREIFAAFAIANNMPVEAMLDHLKAIPGEMIENARREPEILASYDAFIEALMGPQAFPADAEWIGGD
jgi:hypothetical protein